MTISRRTLFRISGGALASAVGIGSATQALAAPAVVGLKGLDTRTLSFDCVNTGEKLNKITYWADGEYDRAALAEISKALRDWHSGDVYPIEPKLLDALHRLGRSMDTNCRFELTSGYRSPETNAKLHEVDHGVAEHSLHMKGQATDITLPGRPLRKVYEAAVAMRAGGVGYYPASNFIHVDIGPVRRWAG